MKETEILSVEHKIKLLAAFDDRPQDYEYNGEVNDLGGPIGKCACGHPIRYEYIWRHKNGGSSVITGSVCVDTVPGLPNDSIERIKAHAEQARKELARKAREVKAKARKAAQQKEVQMIIARFEELFVARGYQDAREATMRGWVEADVYSRANEGRWLRRELRSALSLKTARGQMGRLEWIIKYMEKK